MSYAADTVLPKPQVPKTLGILNIIFGVLLVLVGLCSFGSLLIFPAATEMIQKQAEQKIAKADAQEKLDQQAFDDRAAAATTDEEKGAIAKEKAAAKKPRVTAPDLNMAMAIMKNPTVATVTYVGMGTGLILHVLLLVSGIGLIRLASWGRSMALAWSGLIIVQVIALLAVSIVVVMPITQPMSDQLMAKLEEAVKAPGADPSQVTTLQTMKLLTPIAVPLAIGQSLSGLIYPVILLILLNTAGARAAVLPGKLARPSEY